MNDKKWLIKRVENYIPINDKTVGQVVDNILDIIHQLDEPEVKQIKELDSYNDELIRDNNQLRNALDNQEVLSQEWIKDNQLMKLGPEGVVYYVPVENLQNLLMPKQEELESKIKVLIESYKQVEDAYGELESGWIRGFIKDLKNLVEEGQKYIVVLGESIYNTTTYGQIGEVNSKKIMQSIYANEENIITPNQYTKSEILEVKDGGDIFKRFAVKVEELEE